jgi:hypothetical protein
LSRARRDDDALALPTPPNEAQLLLEWKRDEQTEDSMMRRSEEYSRDLTYAQVRQRLRAARDVREAYLRRLVGRGWTEEQSRQMDRTVRRHLPKLTGTKSELIATLVVLEDLNLCYHE